MVKFPLLCFSKFWPSGEPEEMFKFSIEYEVLQLSYVRNNLRQVFYCKGLWCVLV